VENVVLDTARISRAQNGVRIKTWQGGASYVRNVRFSNAAVQQLSQAVLEISSRKASKSSIQSTCDVAHKSIQLQEGDSSKTAVIGAGLDEK
jgi:hypothetical protein